MSLLLGRAIPARIKRADIFNIALPNADTNLLPVNLTQQLPLSALRFQFCFSVPGILRVVRTQWGIPVIENLNSGEMLVGDSTHIFDIIWGEKDAINLRYSVSPGTILCLLIYEIGGGEL